MAPPSEEIEEPLKDLRDSPLWQMSALFENSKSLPSLCDRFLDGSELFELPYERYADDGVIHRPSEQEAREVLLALGQRLMEVGLALHSQKTEIVYCKGANRKGSYECERFDFLGYRFPPRLVRNTRGQFFVSFLRAISDAAIKAIGQIIRGRRLNLHSDKSLTDFAGLINPSQRGWINYYGRFYPSRLFRTLKRIDEYIIRWARRKYKRLSTSIWRASKWLPTGKLVGLLV